MGLVYVLLRLVNINYERFGKSQLAPILVGTGRIPRSQIGNTQLGSPSLPLAV